MDRLSHLSADRLAELADGEPMPAEAAHLVQCATCAAERGAYQRVLTVAQIERERILPPLSSWDTLAPKLRAEHLIVDGLAERRAMRGWMRAAAAVLLVAGGAVAGRMSAGTSFPAMAGRGTNGAMIPVSDGGVRPAAFRSNDEAIAALTASQQTYQAAITYLSSRGPNGGAPAPEQVQRRIAALDDIAGAVRAALWQAPDDPVVNQTYLQTLGARESALRQLGTALPAGTRLTSY